MRESNQTLWELALNQVKETLSVYDRDQLCEGVLRMIAEDRSKDGTEQRNLIAKSIHIMLALDFYKDFEVQFLTATKSFYK